MWKAVSNILMKNWEIALIIIFGLTIYFLIKDNRTTKRELGREKNNIESLVKDIEVERGKNDESVATILELQYTVEEWRKRSSEDQKMIDELRVKAENVREVVKTVVETRIEYKDTLIQISPEEYIFDKKTEWWDASGRVDLTQDPSTIDIKVHTRDSLSHVLYKVPKCKFLWWEWGTKHYEVKVISHNPYSEITYARWIQLTKKEGGSRE